MRTAWDSPRAACCLSLSLPKLIQESPLSAFSIAAHLPLVDLKAFSSAPPDTLFIEITSSLLMFRHKISLFAWFKWVFHISFVYPEGVCLERYVQMARCKSMLEVLCQFFNKVGCFSPGAVKPTYSWRDESAHFRGPLFPPDYWKERTDATSELWKRQKLQHSSAPFVL